VGAADVAAASVTVAVRVTAFASSTRIKLGTTLSVRGGIAPAHASGSAVYLQRYVSGAWRNVATGRMSSTTAYGVSWRPGSPGVYTLRVLKPLDADHGSGGSIVWRQYVVSETAADVARAIVNNSRITLAPVHVGGASDQAHARQNAVDVSYGRSAHRSSYGNAPGGYTGVDIRVLRAIRAMGASGSVTISEIAGGSHSGNSRHYAGKAVDINWVNGRHVGRGSGYQLALDACRANGASAIYHPSYDPYGGHYNHVHCEWS
jgi:hypothetical protein